MRSLVNSKWLRKNLYDPNLIILDASPKSTVSNVTPKYEDIYIDGAIKIDKANFGDKESPYPSTIIQAPQFEQEARKLGINKGSKIVVYDNLGIYMSPRIWWMFKLMGHDNIAVLDGGLTDWVENNYPTSTDLSKPRDGGNFIANYKGELFRNTEDIKNNIDKHVELIVDARSSGRFLGEVPEPRPGLKGGHIPNSINIPFGAVLDNGKMKNREALEEIFAGVKDRPLIFTCGSGTTACILMLAADQIYDNGMAIYDGSWSEWGSRDDCPVVT